MWLVYKFLPLLIIAVFLVAIFSYLPSRRLVLYKLNLDNDPTTSCCSEEEVLKSSGNFDEGAQVAIFNGQVIDYPKTSLAQRFTFQNIEDGNLPIGPGVLGTKNETGEEKWIEVSLDQQKLRAWEGNKIVMEFPISSGLWSPTPKGDFTIWHKTRYQRMKGGSKELGTYYDLPNVPYNMFFYKGFAIHGAYWHNNFGSPMSHGCVNSPLSNAAQLFEWSGPVTPANKNFAHATEENLGTRVLIH